jgi:hypothetical protein
LVIHGRGVRGDRRRRGAARSKMVGLAESVGGSGGGGGGGGRAESEGKRLEVHYKKAKDAIVVLKCEHSFTRRSLRCA